MGYVSNPGNLTVQEIDRVKNFVFMWNLYETLACGTHANIIKITRAVDDLMARHNPLDIATLQEVITYLKGRYTSNGATTLKFEQLLFPISDAKTLVEQVLLGQNTNGTDILKALLYIVYRFRNNLFHGNKQIANLNDQIENFKAANLILRNVLNAMKANGLP